MLQQTQANRVVPKYEAFIYQFPTVRSLATALNEDVLRLWSGLGYNRRALYLKQAAQNLTTKPNYTPESLSKNKGIGVNTAGAIYVFSKNKPYVFIETNIRRVFISEFFKNQDKILDADILKLVERTMDTKNPREWYYALMDYGAYLKSQTVNPNRKSKHYTKQSKFEGSVRQARGKILKILIEKKKVSQVELEKEIGSPHFKTALNQLENEKFISVNKNVITIK